VTAQLTDGTVLDRQTLALGGTGAAPVAPEAGSNLPLIIGGVLSLLAALLLVFVMARRRQPPAAAAAAAPAAPADREGTPE
jgi:hypothetical protein